MIKIRTKLRFAFCLLAILMVPAFLVLYPHLALTYRLRTYESVALLVFFAAIFCTVFFLLLDLFFTLPLKHLTEEISRLWEHGHTVLSLKKNEPQELTDLHTTFNSILNNIEATSKNLQGHKSLNDLKFTFISTAAHQMRTPLTGIKWALGLALKDPSVKENEEIYPLIQNSLESTERLTDLVNQMLSSIQFKSKTARAEKQAINLETLIKSLIEETALYASSKSVTVTIKKAQKAIPAIEGNGAEIQSVFANLISNAIQYNRKGGRVEILLNYEENTVYAHIRDNGIGIPKEEEKGIFERFFRGKKATSLHTSGSGLGLYVAKEIMYRHGGTISFKSDGRNGTTFTVALPMKQKGELQTFIQY